MKKILLAVCLLGLPGAAIACDLEWDYEAGSSAWIDGFRVYQGGVEVGSALPEARTITCDAAGVVPGPDDVTITAFRGTNESPHSDPAVFVLEAPGLQIFLRM